MSDILDRMKNRLNSLTATLRQCAAASATLSSTLNSTLGSTLNSSLKTGQRTALSTALSIALCATVLTILPASPRVHAQDVVLDQVVAIVNEGVVLTSDVDSEMQFLKDQARSNRQRLPEDEVLRDRVVERLIDVEIQRQRADELGVSIDATSLNRAVENVARNNNMDVPQFRQTLEREGYDYEQFRGNLSQSLLLQRLIQRDVQSRLRVSAQEIDDFLEAQANDARDQRRYRIRHILLAVSPSAPESARSQARERAAALLERLESGEDFATVAAVESDGARALEGGDLGWRSLQEVPRFLSSELRTMAQGDIRGPLQSPNGLHIVQLDDIEDQTQPDQQETLVRHIFLEGDTPSRQSELAALRERIESGESFESLARQYSNDPNSATEGGELPWFGAGQMPRELEQVAAGLDTGVISAPFQTQFGWHILEVLDRRERAKNSSIERREAEQALMQRKVEQESERWIRELRDESFIEKLV